MEEHMQPDYLNWTEAMQAMIDGKKVKAINWSNDIYLARDSLCSKTSIKLNWGWAVNAKWEIVS